MKNALITGASKGLGLALARKLSENGWGLVIDARSKEALEQVSAELSPRSSGPSGTANLVAIPGSVTDETHRQKLAEAARKLGGLDAVVNNASFLGPSPQPPLFDYPLDILQQVYLTNVVAPLAMIQTLRPMLKPDGCIMNITSDAGVEAYAGWGGYGSSKAALEHLSAILAQENPSLRVYWVDPGDMRTQMQQEAFPDEDISDRPLPEESVPGLLALLDGNQPSGRYKARELAEPASD
jgi:NAD(P)-dependent dehydrogenase (short-subunit alcohol dehydrogenase family)